MVVFNNLGFNSFEEYYDEFENSLLKTNHTYSFFVDWKKVYSKLEESVVEIQILNSLNKVSPENILTKFEEIIIKYPQVVPILPTILAIRDKKVDVLDAKNVEFKKINFTKPPFDIKEIIHFCKETGLLDLFVHIEDLYSYLVGIEAGLDTNARKNRSGHVFEDIVGDFLAEKLQEYPGYSLGKEDTIPFERTKRWDYVIYKNNEPVLFFECNFYNSTGSKPIEVAHAYVDLQKQLVDTPYTFIWVTDGPGWKKMSKSLKEVAPDIDYIVNYKILAKTIDNFLK